MLSVPEYERCVARPDSPFETTNEYGHFAGNLKQHAQTEEEVLYPAAILVGEYLKLKSTH